MGDEKIADNQMVKVSIADNGTGMSDAKKNLIMSGKFARNLEGTGGLGIGLALVNQIINRVDGKLMIEDRVPGNSSKGTVVHLLFKKAE